LKTKVTTASARRRVGVERSRDRPGTYGPRPPPTCVDRARFSIHIRSSSRIHRLESSRRRVESTRPVAPRAGMTARARVPSRWPSRRLAASRRGVSVRPGRPFRRDRRRCSSPFLVATLVSSSHGLLLACLAQSSSPGRARRRRVARFVSFRFARVDEVLASTSDDSPMTYGPSDHESSLVLYRVYPGVHAKTRLVLVLSRRVRRALLRVYALDVRARSIDRSIVHSCPVSSSFVGHALDRETRARVERRATAGAMKGRFRPRATATATTTTTTRGVVSERHHRHRRALESSRERVVSSLVR
jgi:hypothetical protein